MSTAEYNARVVEALKAAMRLQGMEGNKSAFARLLNALVGDGPAPNTVGRWLRGEQVIPAWALVASAEAAKADVGQLLGRAAQPAPEQVRALQEELERQRRASETMERRMEELAARVAGRNETSAAGADAGPGLSPSAEGAGPLKPLAAAIIVRDGKALLTERRYPGHGERWSWPSGKIEHGESLEDAVLRELHEELLITDAQVTGYLGSIDLPSGYRMSHFHVTIPASVEPKLNDYEQLVRPAWMTRSEVEQAFKTLDPEIAQRALAFLDQVLASTAGAQAERGARRREWARRSSASPPDQQPPAGGRPTGRQPRL